MLFIRVLFSILLKYSGQWLIRPNIEVAKNQAARRRRRVHHSGLSGGPSPEICAPTLDLPVNCCASLRSFLRNKRLSYEIFCCESFDSNRRLTSGSYIFHSHVFIPNQHRNPGSLGKSKSVFVDAVAYALAKLVLLDSHVNKEFKWLRFFMIAFIPFVQRTNFDRTKNGNDLALSRNANGRREPRFSSVPPRLKSRSCCFSPTRHKSEH